VTAEAIEDIKVFGAEDKPYGLTYGEWTTRWWDWIMTIPKEKSPLLDDTGARWNTNQPSSDIWYLIGNFATEENAKKRMFPQRKITMGAGRSVLFPVLNCIASFLEYSGPPFYLKTHEDLLKHVQNDVNSVIRKDLFINNKKYDPLRIASDPKIVKVTIIENNAFDIKNTGLTDAAADGYWVFLRPLSKGNYTIKFEGSCENGRLSAGASYEIDVA
jgi:hypothetical protein